MMKKVPKRRFKGFLNAGDWEQRKLIYIFSDFIVPMRDKPKVFSGTTPWTRIEDIEGRYINTSLSGQFVSDETIKSMNLKVIPKGSLIVSASATFGVVAIVNNDLITNQTFIGLVPNKDFDIDFLYFLFEAPTTKDKLLKLSAGSTIFYIARESFENLVLSVPSKAEQMKISKIFKSIDDSITLHQRKLEKLQATKKALLYELFPIENSRRPKRRFKGFTDDWEQRKLGDVVKRESVTQVSSTEYPAIEYEDVIPETGQLNKDIYKKGVQKVGILFDANKVLYGKLRPYLHNWVAPMYTGVAVGDWWVLNPCGLDRGFLYTLIQTVKFDTIANQSAGSKMPRADWKLLSTTEFSIPSLDEQIKIGKLVEGLNDYITLHQRKLEKLKNLKAAYLNEMFV